MPVFPWRPRPLALDGDYPHMTKHDVQVWERFLRQHAAAFEAVAYDVALGGILPPDRGADDPHALMWRYSTAVRVDAVLVARDSVWVVEVKPRGSPSAIGQALCGATLWEADDPVGLDVVPAVVCATASADVRYCAEQLGVVLVEVGLPELPDALAAVRPDGGGP